jgi:hypothetical protein
VTIQDQQNEDGEKQPQSDNIVTPSAPPVFAGESRRRFTKAGLAASGVILSLASKPGMACEICASPSGSLSGGLNSHHGPAPVCNGRPPSYWHTCSTWPSGCNSSNHFRTVFHVPSSQSMYYPPTCGQAVNPQGLNDGGLGSCLMAAYLNACAGYTSYLTPTMVQSIFNEWQSTGYYTPSAGVRWDSQQIVAYLTGTQN